MPGANYGFGSAFTGQQGNANSGPGFWTGLGTGGVLGYLFGSNRQALHLSHLVFNANFLQRVLCFAYSVTGFDKENKL